MRELLVCGSALVLTVAAVARPAPPAAVVALRATPARIELNGPYASARLLVDAIMRTGGTRDAGHEATLSIASARVAAVEPDGAITARGDGDTVLTARFGGRAVRVPIHVHGVAHAGAPR